MKDTSSETAKKYQLLEEETHRFVQDLVARAVEPPIERFRESAAKALEGPTARLSETREAVVQAIGELGSRVGSKLESLQEILDEALEGVPRRPDLERLHAQAEARQRLIEGLMEALARFSMATSSGLEKLAANLRPIEARLGALEAKLDGLESGDRQQVRQELAGLQARLEAPLEEIGRKVASLQELTARPREEDRSGSTLANLESGLVFLQERSQASMEHFRALATQSRDLRGEVATVSSQILALPARSGATLTELQAVEERLAGRVQAEARKLMRAFLLSWGLLVLLLIILLLLTLRS